MIRVPIYGALRPNYADAMGRPSLDAAAAACNEDHTNDTMPMDGVDEMLEFRDFPGGPDGTSVTFRLWLVSLNADGSLHSFHDGGIEWTFENPTTPGVDDTSDWTATQTLSLLGGPSEEEYDNIIEDFATSVPATVWDTVFNNSNSPVSWSPGLWTRDGEVIGITFPDGITQPGTNPPEVASDHIHLPETPNDFHFSALLPEAETRVDVWAFWDSRSSPGFEFEFEIFTVPGVEHLDLTYQFQEGLEHLLVQDVSSPSIPQVLFNGPSAEFDPALLDVGQGPGSFAGDQQLVQVMPEMGELLLAGDFNSASGMERAAATLGREPRQ